MTCQKGYPAYAPWAPSVLLMLLLLLLVACARVAVDELDKWPGSCGHQILVGGRVMSCKS